MPSSKLSDLFVAIHPDLKQIDHFFEIELARESGFVSDIIRYLMLSGGKRLRPALALLCGYLSSSEGRLKPKHYVLAQLTELIHTASLVHDDFIDQADSRRGHETGHLQFGARVAVIAGDYLFAQASVSLGELENSDIVKIYANVLARLCAGEIAQAQARFDLEAISLERYIEKSTWKTASLFAAGSRSAAILNECSSETIQSLHDYGLNLGLAYQIIDDLIDMTSTSEELGKPAMSDLANGIITAPVIYALQDASIKVELRSLIQGGFSGGQGLEKTYALVTRSAAITQTQKLAKNYGEKALEALSDFSDSPYKAELINLVSFVLERKA